MTEKKLLFPGCVIGNRIPFIENSARKVFEKVQLEVEDAPFGCCPDPVGFQSVDRESWLALGARNLVLAEERKKDIISLCNGCTQTLVSVEHELKHDPREKEKINNILKQVNKEFKGTINVYHFVQVLHDEVGIDKIKEAITRPLTNLKLVCHTGCHYSRPSSIMQYDDPFEPKALRDIVSATGANVLDYEEEALCCGAGAGNADPKVGLMVLKRKMDSIKKVNPDAIVVICPSCFQQFENNQKALTKEFGGEYNIPILYLTELLALAMGYSYEDLNLKLHRIKPKQVAEKI
ncbi:MAG: CoB--CoM heterodisulfide reductase iron-sulfur subunit B family protein [Promethearchaeota archaeon]